jgi:hypothetical protein
VFDIENDFLLQVSLLRNDSDSVSEVGRSQYSLHPRRRCTLVEFHDASQVQIVELSYQLSDKLHLSCRFTDEFDCHPHALACNKSELPDDGKILAFSTQSNRVLASEGNWMSEVFDNRMNAEAFIFGGDPGKDSTRICAKVP